MTKKCKTCERIFNKKYTVSIKKWKTTKFCCNNCYWEYLKTISPHNKGIPQPSTVGENNPNWKGGISRLQDKIRGNIRYSMWRAQIFKRDEFTCQSCGIKGKYLEAHHLVAFSKLLHKNKIQSVEEALDCEELWQEENGISLCKSCHSRTDNHAGRQRKTTYV
jgi:hypothetical protein